MKRVLQTGERRCTFAALCRWSRWCPGLVAKLVISERRSRVLRTALRKASLAALSLIAIVGGALLLAAPASGHSGPRKVGILDAASSSGGTFEKQQADGSGLEATIIDESRWRAMTTADFKAFDALVIGERSCTSAYQVLHETASAWSAAITGNRLLIGTDPSDHYYSGGVDLVRDGIVFAAAEHTTGLYMAFECDYNDAEMTRLLDDADGTSGEFQTRTAGCYDRAHRVAEHPAFVNTTDASLSNWGCSVHNAFERWPSRYRVLAIAEELGTFTAPDGTTGLPYVLASGEDLTYTGRDLVALGDSVSSGEGIGYGYAWNNSAERWEDKNGSRDFWEVDGIGQPIGCHQREEAHPRVLARISGADLKEHLSCSGATFDEGLAGRQDVKDVTGPQIGGFPGSGLPLNPRYRDARPDLVTLSLGANDIGFGDVVASCFFRLGFAVAGGRCESRVDRANELLDDGSVAGRLRRAHEQILATGEQAGKRPLVLQTEYVNPFPAADRDQQCYDIEGSALFGGFGRDEINDMVAGLRKLNGRIRERAAATDGVISVPASAAFAEHGFCSDDPWVFGMDTAVDGRGTPTAVDVSTKAPFHPTADGQAEIARQIKRTLDSTVSMRRSGSNVVVGFASGESLTFNQVDEPGTTAVVKTPAAQLPLHRDFAIRSGYQIETAADFTGSIRISLPAEPGDRLWHYTQGRWQEVPAATNGASIEGRVDSLSPFAVGPQVDPVAAKVTGADGGEAPESVALSAASSTGEIDEVSWDFGDGTTATGVDVSHTYRYSGTYEATATVRSVDGAIDEATKIVRITNPAPKLVASVPQTANLGDEVELDSRASSDANGRVERGWWEVDGTLVEPAAQRSVVRLQREGAVDITAVVADDELKETRQTFTVRVAAPGGGAGATAPLAPQSAPQASTTPTLPPSFPSPVPAQPPASAQQKRPSAVGCTPSRQKRAKAAHRRGGILVCGAARYRSPTGSAAERRRIRRANRVRVAISVSGSTRRRLGLKRATLGTRTATVTSRARYRSTVRLSAGVRSALGRQRLPVRVTVRVSGAATGARTVILR